MRGCEQSAVESALRGARAALALVAVSRGAGQPAPVGHDSAREPRRRIADCTQAVRRDRPRRPLWSGFRIISHVRTTHHSPITGTEPAITSRASSYVPWPAACRTSTAVAASAMAAATRQRGLIRRAGLFSWEPLREDRTTDRVIDIFGSLWQRVDHARPGGKPSTMRDGSPGRQRPDNALWIGFQGGVFDSLGKKASDG